MLNKILHNTYTPVDAIFYFHGTRISVDFEFTNDISNTFIYHVILFYLGTYIKTVALDLSVLRQHKVFN